MGVIDNEFKRLQDVVTGLEDRVKRLEQRQSGDGQTKIPEDGVRMILIGPPGAGVYLFSFLDLPTILPLRIDKFALRDRREMYAGR